jgi:uncharacterized protein Yka (UPF0111/DUF47 family)
MNALQKLLTKDLQFFDLLEAVAAETVTSVKGIRPSLSAATPFVRSSKNTHEQIQKSLVKALITPIERGDIESLSNALRRIRKAAEKFCERYPLCNGRVTGDQFANVLAQWEKVAELLEELVKHLRLTNRPEQVEKLVQLVHEASGYGEQMVLACMKTLYERQSDTLSLLAAKDLYGVLEKGFDRCRIAGDIVMTITLKSS